MERKVKVGDKFSSLSEVGATCPEGTKLRKVVHATARGEFAVSEWTNGYEVVELPGSELPTGLGAVVELFDPQDGIVHDTVVLGPHGLWWGGSQSTPWTYSNRALRALLGGTPSLEMRVISEGVSL